MTVARRRLYITLVNGVMRGGLCVRRLARPNCHTLTLSFLQVDGVQPHPRPPPHAPTAFFTQSFCKNSVQYQRLLVQYQLYREPPIFKPIDRRQGRERLESLCLSSCEQDSGIGSHGATWAPPTFPLSRSGSDSHLIYPPHTPSHAGHKYR